MFLQQKKAGKETRGALHPGILTRSACRHAAPPLGFPPLSRPRYSLHATWTLNTTLLPLPVLRPFRVELPLPRSRCRSGLGRHEWGRIRYQMAMPMGLTVSGEECCPMTASLCGLTAD